jgi:deoxyribodipyrimidine photo-lyase
MTPDVPAIRVLKRNGQTVASDGDYVLYWMISSRRMRYNFALDRAEHWSRKLGKPLMILEALRCGYAWASDRIHQFVIEGMIDNSSECKKRGLSYYPYLEPKRGAGSGLLETLAKKACVVITDEFPCFFLPAMVAAAAAKIPVLLESVDSNGLYPLAATELVFSSAHQFRRHLQKFLPPFLSEFPSANPHSQCPEITPAKVSSSILARWPMAQLDQVGDGVESLKPIPIDHSVPVAPLRGGSKAAQLVLKQFLTTKLEKYDEKRNDLDECAASGLSPYLHFGHLSVHEVFHEAAKREHWTPAKLNPKAHGSREDWWRTSPPLEAFLDELVTWRELGYHFCARVPNYDQFESLPAWALATLKVHAKDKRSTIYALEEFESGQTHDPLWNAAQTQLVREGKIHNYLRMLWGKKILEWSESPQAALEIMIELNNKYALDGRDPNSYSGIFWTLGRFDRPWGPERPIFGTVRYMSSENTARKLSVKRYLETYSPTTNALGEPLKKRASARQASRSEKRS